MTVNKRLDEIANALEKLTERVEGGKTSTENKMGKQKSPMLLVQAVEEYYQFLVNFNIRAHEVRQLSNRYIHRIFQVFKILRNEIIRHGRSYAAFKVSDINDDVVGWFYEALDKMNYSNPTFNDRRGIINTFEIWLIDKGYLKTRHFIKIKKRIIVHNPKCITKTEFETLINLINQEPDRYRNLENIKYRDHYQPWLAKGLQFALEIGGRMDDVMNLKFSNIIEENGSPVFIKVEDFKYNRRWNLNNQKSKKYRSLPISKNLLIILNQSGYSKMKGSEEFIFLSDVISPHLRNYIIPNILKTGFLYYYKKLNTGRHLTFKSLRKADITNKYLLTEGHPEYLSGHSSRRVAINHYVNKEEIAKYYTQIGYSVFPEEEVNFEDIRPRITKSDAISKPESNEVLVIPHLLKHSNQEKQIFNVKTDSFGIIQGEHPFISLRP